MKTLEQIKVDIAGQRLKLRGDRHALRACTNETREVGRRLLGSPGSLIAGFVAGWCVDRYTHRPKKIRQARNVTIKKTGLSRQLLQTIVPFVISELRTRPASVEVAENADTPPDPLSSEIP